MNYSHFLGQYRTEFYYDNICWDFIGFYRFLNGLCEIRRYRSWEYREHIIDLYISIIDIILKLCPLFKGLNIWVNCQLYKQPMLSIIHIDPTKSRALLLCYFFTPPNVVSWTILCLSSTSQFMFVPYFYRYLRVAIYLVEIQLQLSCSLSTTKQFYLHPR